MPLELERYAEQLKVWPDRGRVILAQFDAHSVVVYQAYNSAIASFAVRNGRFGGEFSFSRMSWIKPNFLWMMYRSGWASKEGQEAVLAVRIRRNAFVRILERVVHSKFVPGLYASPDDWKREVKSSDVRLQWDPDHAPNGAPQRRRAVQLGLRGDTLLSFGTTDIVSIEDISGLVREQREELQSGGIDALMTPRERPFPVHDVTLAARLELDEEDAMASVP